MPPCSRWTTSPWSLVPRTASLRLGNIIQAVCYARGTMIRTPDGELPVEKLRPGKQVITLVDGEEVPQTVKWLGHRRIDLDQRIRGRKPWRRSASSATPSPTTCRTATCWSRRTTRSSWTAS